MMDRSCNAQNRFLKKSSGPVLRCEKLNRMHNEPLIGGKVSRWADVEQGDTFLGSNGFVFENLKVNKATGQVELKFPSGFN